MQVRAGAAPAKVKQRARLVVTFFIFLSLCSPERSLTTLPVRCMESFRLYITDLWKWDCFPPIVHVQGACKEIDLCICGHPQPQKFPQPINLRLFFSLLKYTLCGGIWKTVMHDADIRKILHEVEMKRICALEPTTRVIDELGIFEGKFRIDVAVVNDFLHGYEIKSAEDNLDRLQSQQAAYNKVFDKLTLVADEHHVEEAMKVVPPWWGLMVAGMRNGVPYVDEIWAPRLNPEVDPFAVCQLLWKEEAMSILQERKLSAGLWTSRRKVLWEKLTLSMDLGELREIVRETLKNRENWREGSRRKGRSKKRSRSGGRASNSASSKQSAKPISKKSLRMAEGAIRNAILTYGL